MGITQAGRMGITLQILNGSRSGESFHLASRQKIVFGRDLSCDVPLQDEGTSRRHFSIEEEDAHWTVRDLGSSNGTYLNGKRVERSPVVPGDVITAGDTQIALVADGPAARTETTTVRVRSEDKTVPYFQKKRRLSDVAFERTPPPGASRTRAFESLRTLYQLGNAIHHERSLDVLCRAVLETLLRSVHAERGCVVLADERGRLEPIAVHGSAGGGELQVSRTILNESVLTGLSTISSDAMSDQRFQAEDSVHLHSIRAVMCVPLQGRERILGAIYVDSRNSPDAFDEEDLELMTAIGKQAGTAVERTLLEQEIRKSEERYRGLVANSPDGIIQTTVEGRIAAFNQAALEIFKTTAEEFASWNAKQLYYDPSERERVLEMYRSTGTLRNHELVCRDARGDKLVVSISSRALRDAETGEQRFEVFLRDITASRALAEALAKSEEKYRTIFEQAPVVIALISPTGHLTDLNPHGLAICGPAALPAGDQPGKSLYSMLPDAKREMDGLLGRGVPFERTGLTCTSAGGEALTLDVQGVPLLDASGGVQGGIVLAQDVTREKKLRDSYLRQERMASIGLLAAGVAHEFNNLMASMMGYAQMVGRKPEFTPEKLKEVVLTQCKRARQITDGLMSFSRQKDESRAATDLKALLEDVFVLVRKELEQNKIQLVTRFGYVPPTRINAGQVQQVFLNVLINAVHAMTPGGGTLTVSLEARGGWAYVAFQDTGHGIKREDMDKIFHPFFTTKGPIGKSSVPGTGLGLSVSYNVIKDHQGEIMVESEPGVGSTFTILLPLAEAGPTPSPAVPAEASPRRAPDRRLRILVVEDEPELLEVVAGMLDGHEVRRARSGAEALELCRRERFDRCLLDVLMPGELDGFATFDALRGLDPETRIVFVTARIEDERMREYARKADGYLRKPFTPEELLEALA